MTEYDLVEQMAKKAGLGADQAEQALDAIVNIMTNELAAGGSIALRGLGTFSLVRRKARSGRNFRTGEAITIPARRAVRFNPSRRLKESLN